MRGLSGALLVLSGSVLLSAALIADAVVADGRGGGRFAYVLGSVIGAVGMLLVVAGPLKEGWDAIPVDGNEQNKDT